MTRIRKLLATLALGLAFGLAAAQTTLVVGTVAEASDLDPRTTYDVYSYQRMYPIMEPLLVFAPDLSYSPRLAESWEWADDASSITFYLRRSEERRVGKECRSLRRPRR